LHEYSNTRYPGKEVLEKGKNLLEQIDRIKETKAFYEYLHNEKVALPDYEEDVQDVKKFFKNQRSIFDNALKMLDIYESNRSYVLDPETIKLVEEIERITRLQSPYSEIHRLPELTEQFRNRFAQLLEVECEPINASIKADLEITKSDLNRRSFKDKYLEKVRKDFDALIDRLARANNIYEAIAMQTESDRMKQRFIQTFIDEEARLAADAAKAGDDAPPPPIHKIKTVSAKMLFGGTNQVSSRQDIDRLLDELRKKLEAQLEEDTTIQII
ncbi:MAG: BREX system P-loop protein BrxC, partial [Eubacteriales bacterium]|nr:BREX system P-loop protein BrxC [Eubacteriales bacterium]